MLQAWLQKLITYNYWAHQQVWDCVLPLSDAQFTQNSDYSIGSVKAQMVHMLWAEEVWLNRILGITEALTYQPEDFPDAKSIQVHWATVEQQIRHLVATADDTRLMQSITYQNALGTQFQQSIMGILLHVVNHGTDHRAQTLALLHQLGAETTPQDLIHYLRQ